MDNILQEDFSIGRKIERIRRIKGLKQEALAKALGISHQAVSKIEQSDSIDDAKLSQIADALGVTPEAIKNFREDAAINYIQYNYEGSNKEASIVSVLAQQCTFNPLEKYVQAVEDNKKLYEALLKSEREKIEMLQNQLKDKKAS